MKSKGCLFTIIFIILCIFFGNVGWYLNEARNEQARAQFKEVCTEELFVKDQDQKKWPELERLIDSEAIDNNDLSIREERYVSKNYTEPYDRDLIFYSRMLGKLRRVENSDRLFRLRKNVFLNGQQYTYIDDLVLVTEAFIKGPLSSGVWLDSCYDTIPSKYKNIMDKSYHLPQYKKRSKNAE